MDEFASQIFRLPPPFNAIVLVMGMLCIGHVLSSLIKNVRGYADREADRRMKLEMVRSGMAVEEAERWATIEMAPARSESGETVTQTYIYGSPGATVEAGAGERS
ncbi:MAG: hypothetical protein AAF805_13210 [Planctomycetota bacterium]